MSQEAAEATKSHCTAGCKQEQEQETDDCQGDRCSIKLEGNLIELGQNSKLVILDSNGHVVFSNNNVRLLAVEQWESGAYTALVNDEIEFAFSL